VLLGAYAGAGAARADTTTYNVWPLGDSITEGMTNGGGLVPGGYRAPLNDLLNTAGVSHVFVGTSTVNPTTALVQQAENHHDGHPGYRVDQISADLTGVANGNSDDGGYWLPGVGTRGPITPDVIVIHLGTNDILQDYDPGVSYPTSSGLADYSNATQRHKFVTDLTVRLGTLVESLYTLRPQTRIVLADIAPLEINADTSVNGDYYYGVLQLLAHDQALHRRIVLADVYHSFFTTSNIAPTWTPGLMSTGGVHPTSAGYRVMAGVIATAVEKAFALT
jgi:lysophospholipase L1-like esterase